MPVEFVSFLFRSDLAHLSLDAVCHDLFTLFYLANVSLFIAVTTTFEIVPLQENRQASLLYNGTLVLHVAITMVSFVIFGDCAQEVLERATEHVGKFGAGYVFGLAHFSITHRFLMLVALVFKQHLQADDEDSTSSANNIFDASTPNSLTTTSIQNPQLYLKSVA
eukprot:993305-Amphidinium_carterae.1